MQTYAVVDDEFRFVKIGRTSDLESRIATLNTASPRQLLLMALFDGDIEQDMHRMLAEHRERLEWFRYNEQTETTIIVRMNPTTEWLRARAHLRKQQRDARDPNRMRALDVGALSKRQRDAMCRMIPATDRLGRLFGIPDESFLKSVIDRAHKKELCDTRALLTVCAQRARADLERHQQTRPLQPDLLAESTFAIEVVKSWKRRIGMELAALMGARLPSENT